MGIETAVTAVELLQERDFRLGDVPLANDADAVLVTPGGFVRPLAPERKHNHYFKPVGGLSHVDVYRVLHLFSVTDPCLQHAVKKLLVAGGRGGGKDISRDIQEAIDTLKRWQEMRAEEITTTTN